MLDSDLYLTYGSKPLLPCGDEIYVGIEYKSGNEVRIYPGPWWKVCMRMLARTFKRILLSVIKGVCVFSRVMWYDDDHVSP